MVNRKQFFLLTLGCALTGCGGGGDIDIQAPITPKVRIKWPALGRAMEANPYAMSVKVTLQQASLSTNSSVIILANRFGEEAYEAVYVADEPIRSGFVRAQVQFFSDPNGQGRELVTGTQEVQPDAEGFLPDLSLQGGSGEVIGIRLSLMFGESTTMKVGESRNLLAPVELKQSFGISTLNPEDYKWEFTYSEPEKGPVLAYLPPMPWPSGIYTLRGLRPGTATLRVSVEGKASEPLVITVVPADAT